MKTLNLSNGPVFVRHLANLDQFSETIEVSLTTDGQDTLGMDCNQTTLG